MIFNLLGAQLEEQKINNWASTVKADLEDLNIELNISQIENMKTETFKTFARTK